ncbi:MAG: protein-glutamate O-methyltransferase [Paracoccus sp. (in: a-proteobacteria)]|uniref:CheR family methyltransferase n=1 Tax=Paracoccus sp. TaxID=267 RepID=UPI0026DEED4F|nr:protein-glutamate O-methyltransferase [Paracoccus sp. (in: a-proteobacteria)]MDO5622025.1 protein-glutamate O-methyltransferase [Paracoccus sp. (in: a-proteobacteria)]
MHQPSIPPEPTERLRRIIERESGITISPDKQALLRARLGKRLRALGLKDLESYADLVSNPAHKAEVSHLLSAITTNHTAFFREGHHFDILRDDYQARAKKLFSPYRVWSAGCSTGQEPYSIAMVLDMLQDGKAPGFRINASDIDETALATAEAGIYEEREISTIPADIRNRYFSPASDGLFSIDKRLRLSMRFDRVNLHADWPVRGPFDAVFCRNVMIYFDRASQEVLWQRIADILRPGGLMFIGHSESLPVALRNSMEIVNSTTYRRPLA